LKVAGATLEEMEFCSPATEIKIMERCGAYFRQLDEAVGVPDDMQEDRVQNYLEVEELKGRTSPGREEIVRVRSHGYRPWQRRKLR